jgi:CRISPR-associated protein Csd1
MILQALCELAVRLRAEGELGDPDFPPRRVDVILTVDDSGALLGQARPDDAPSHPCPPEPPRTGDLKPGFLVSTAEWVLGVEKTTTTRPGQARVYSEAFRKRVYEAAITTCDPGLMAVSRFLAQIDVRRPQVVAGGSLRGSEVVGFTLYSDNGTLVHRRRAVVQYWKSQRAQERSGGQEDRKRCLVTGTWGALARTHGCVLPVALGETNRPKLVSFKQPSFWSFGLEQGQNAPTIKETEQDYLSALNHMLAKREPDGFRSGVRIGPRTAVLFWTRQRGDVAEVLRDLLDPAAETADDGIFVATAPWRGLPPAPGDEDNGFCALSLGQEKTRLVVRDWFEETTAAVKRNVGRYFEDLRIGERVPVRIPLREMVEAVAGPDGSGIPPGMASDLFACAVRGRPFPRLLIAAALRRLRLPPSKKSRLDDEKALQLRCAAIKATLIRLHAHDPNPLEVTVSLDEQNTQVPYLLGRLFAAVERLQQDALGSVNTTIRDRYFQAASSTPALVFGRLLGLSMHHAAKAQNRRAEKAKGRIMDALPSTSPFPATLGLEDQGLFAVGYYHQREAFFRKAPDGAAAGAGGTQNKETT